MSRDATYKLGMSAPKFIFAQERATDGAAVERLSERAFGPGRYAKTAYRLREGVGGSPTLSFVARVGTLLVGANRMTPIVIGDTPALLLGPLVVEPAFRQLGLGEQLVRLSLDAARAEGHRLVLLVGDEGYYAKTGFKPPPPGRIILPGPVDPERVLICELTDGAAAQAFGNVRKAM